jgi:hypothetical protein
MCILLSVGGLFNMSGTCFYSLHLVPDWWIYFR